MLLKVRVTPASREAGLTEAAAGEYKAKVRARPEKGAANKELVALVAAKFGVPKSGVRVVRGALSRDKVVEVSA